MKVLFIAALILSLVAIACGADATDAPTPTTALDTPTATPTETPTPTDAPTETPVPSPTPTNTPMPTATPTPSPIREWNLEGIQVDGPTVTVLVRVFAGIDVKATLDGKSHDQLNTRVPILEFVFENVTPGDHTIEVKDVVGFTETAGVVVRTMVAIPTSTPTPTEAPDTSPTVTSTPTLTALPTPTPTPRPTSTPTPTPTPTPAPLAITIGASKDNTLYESADGSLSNGSGEHLFVGRSNTSNTSRRAVIAFDIASSIPAGSTISSVTLTLNMSRAVQAPGPQTLALHSLTADWGEGSSDADGNEGSGASSTSGDATWVHSFFSATKWGSAGGDFSGTASATASVVGIGAYTWGSTSQMVNDVQGWLDNPSSNFGWLLQGNESTNKTTKRFDSRENGTPSNRPALTVEYAPP